MHLGDLSVTSRTDGGARCDVGFFGSDPERLFFSLQQPAGTARAGVVICPPLHADFAKDYRNEVLLARALAREGFAVLRLHHRGQGHSDGDPSRMTFDSLREDCLGAVDLLRSTTGITTVGLIGCRLGGLTAAEAASACGGAAIGLWEPVVDPAAYLREAIRSIVMAELTGGSEARGSSDSIRDRLRRDGWIDVHGYPIHLGLIESLEGRNLRDAIGPGAPPVLLLAIGRGKELRREYADTVGRWTELGVEVTAHQLSGEVAWWYRGAAQDRERTEEIAGEFVPRTVTWMTSVLSSLEASA